MSQVALSGGKSLEEGGLLLWGGRGGGELLLGGGGNPTPLYGTLCTIYIFADFSAYAFSLPPPARPHLELQLDSDIHQIADHMLELEEKLSAHLGLTAVDISDIKERNPSNPELQR